jgi:small-conductance mechanosensitive channel
VTSRDVLLAEVGAAFGILGLLLVFLPLFLRAFERAVGGEQPYEAVRAIGFRVSFVALTVAIAALVVTLGLFALWLRSDPLAVLTGGGLLVVTWCVVILAGLAISTR